MLDCIFTPHCMEPSCDKSCPKYVEVSYLLERNGIAFNNPVFSNPCISPEKVSTILENNKGKFLVYVPDKKISTADAATVFTYAGICNNWRGNQLHCSVYNLKYAQYIEANKNSWSTRDEPENLQYMRLFSESAKLLIISNIDYVNFGDYESQVLLTLIQNRLSKLQTTILISPDPNLLVGPDRSRFFPVLMNMIKTSREVNRF